MQEHSSNGTVQKAAALTPGAIGYVSLEFVDETVKAFTLSGIAPTVENVINNTYELNHPLLMITNGEPTGLATKFFDFILSDEGQNIIAENGFVPVNI